MGQGSGLVGDKYDAFKALSNHVGVAVPCNKKDVCRKLGAFAFLKFAALAKRTKKRMADRKNNRHYLSANMDFDPASVVPDPVILANFMVRVKKFGDLFNGKTEDEMKALL